MGRVHKTAIVEGNVELGEEVRISAYAVLRGDEGKISVGGKTSIQEHCTLHGPGVRIGEGCTIGHNAVLHGCTIGNNVLIGIHATVLDGAEVGEWSIVGAGAVVTPGTKIPPNSLVLGVPGKVVRELRGEDKLHIVKSCKNYLGKEL